ncbi:type I restriction endonuclease subunit R [Aeromonas caviae]|uniref:Type I restriction enzyme endonuclease subunit n=5 Tax=Gammaproteobacteria TaxID=1236 RepID=A0A5F0KBK3_9GAMM|nr:MULTISPECIES: type I restriction endonuclease subunit R [Aeromonas]HCI1686647.1 type I restriction endonuclease subunit R [Pseudomonas aeruginosa]MCO4224355.1 type I restriction endonuclease subunit R [Aeromonas hydrophila]MDK3163826.1 type I restriction endonuclease subunit R [Aeromonas caviae]OCW45008.1 DEAD/DEAH box helicase [Aeromonas caviae]TFF72375.1 type I restriction endonuclease subunit R [Aeromonas taiwanensis]
MTQPAPKFQEEYSAKLPALTLLTNLGWSFLSPEQALAARGGKADEVVLRQVLRSELQKRTFTFAGKSYPLSEKAIDNLIAEVCSPALNEGLLTANERLYNHLLYGISVTEFVEGKKVNPTVALIDWQNPANNSFVFTEEFTVTRSGGVESRRPDIVCFVNGIPLVVIEAKRPDGNAKKGPTIDEGISQSLRNQRHDEIPLLFAYSQLLLSINGNDGRYGTCGTPAKFWAAWREEDISDAQMHTTKNKALNDAQLANLFSHRPAKDLDWYQSLVAGGELAVTGQDQLLISLLSPARLLEMTRYFTLFDKKAGKIVARYQQVFGIKRLIERINTRSSTGGREGGVIWHTTGSGKSFTMVFLSKALILHDSLKQCRIVVVTDRVDLEDQLSKTFASGGELAGKKDKAAAMATSGKRLAEQIGKGTERIVFSLIQKFNTATKLPECVNNSADVIVLIDEGHRSQGGENHIRMKQALPNAAFVAFTGTPLLKDDKTTNKFGPIVHAYTMQRAVEDKTVTPLLYEERIPDLDVNERAIDSWFERITEGLSDEQKADLKRKFAKKGQVYSADDRIRLIALDIANHFVKNIDDGLKGQLACDSKLSAIKYKKYLDEAGLFESAVVMSPPDSREGNTAIDEAATPEVTQWWKDNVGSQDEQAYTKHLIERFDKDDSLKILIVVDKLLTGFDEPKNAVLYIDKPLKEHNLIQAIARVNRLHPKKQFGLLIDYRGILAELDTTIAKYQDLASRTQGGYDINDIAGLYNQMSTEYKRLPQLYKQLWAIFDGVKNKNDIEQLRQVLVPKIEEQKPLAPGESGELVDVHLKVREDFYEALTAFASCLKVALQSATFFEDKSFSDADRRHYKETVKQFSSLRQLVQQDAGERIDYDEYADQVKKLLDKHVVGVQVKEPDGVYEVGKMGQSTQPQDWSEDKTRNETDIIKTRVTRMIEQELRDDPYAQEAFSALLRQAIEEAEKLFDHPLKQYMLFREFEEQVQDRRLGDIPDVFAGNRHAQAYFGVFKKVLPAALAVMDQQVQDKWVKVAFEIDQAVETSVAEHSINPQNIEADIRKKLLPRMFQECKAIGGGMDQAKNIVEMIVQITRVGLSGL